LQFDGESFTFDDIESEDGSAQLVDTGTMLQLRSTASVWTIWFQPREISSTTGLAGISYLLDVFEDPPAYPELLVDCAGVTDVAGSMPGNLQEGPFSSVQFVGGASLTLPECGGPAPPPTSCCWTNFNLTYEICG
jgi:hypothetical protein